MCRKIALIENHEDFDRLVKQNDKPAVVEFSASWCGASHINAPVLRELSQTFSDTVSFYRINIEKNKTFAGEYGIYQVPTLLLFNRGEPVDHASGPVPRELLIRKIIALVKNRNHSSVSVSDDCGKHIENHKFSHIVVPIDFNTLSQASLEYAAYAALAFRAKITLLHINQGRKNQNSPESLKQMETIARDIQKKVSTDSNAPAHNVITSQSIPSRGLNAGDTILEYINNQKSDLVVMGTHGRSGRNTLLFGSTAERIVRFSPVPAITMNMPFLPGPVRNILVPVDFSELSCTAISWGRSLARTYNARLHITHVLNMDLHPEYTLISEGPLLSTNPSLKDQLMKTVQKFTNINETQAVFSVLEGSPHKEICNYSREQEMDLIVMAVRSGSTYEHSLIGGITERVVKTSHCPVLTVGRNAGA